MFNSLSLKVIIFGFIFTFFSSFGQSFFLGLFNSSIRDALSITHGQFGSIYASATLLSGLLIIWVGKKIDDIDVFKFASFATILLSFSCYFFSKVSSIIFLFIAIFLRICTLPTSAWLGAKNQNKQPSDTLNNLRKLIKNLLF